MRFPCLALIFLLTLASAHASEAPDISPFLPELKPWKLVKGTQQSDLLGSEVPRVPELIYQRNVSASIDPVITTPLVEGGRLFLADGGGLYALNASTGELLWGVDVAAVAEAPAGGAGGYIELEKDKRARQGWDVERWRFLALGTGLTYFSYGVGKHAYIATATTQPDVLKPYEEPVLIAIDKSTGEVLWQRKFGFKEQSASGNLIVSEGMVCVAAENRIYCFTEDGEPAWSYQVEGGAVLGFAASDGVLYATTPGTAEEKAALYAFDMKSGRLLWKYSPGGGMSAPVAKRGRVFVLSDGLVALSEDGKELWRKSLGTGSDIYGNPYLAVSESRLYAVRDLGERPLNLYVLDFSGNVVGNFTFAEDEQPAGAPVVAGNLVLLPVVKWGENAYTKIYLLWRGTAKLHELSYSGREVARPKASAAGGRIYALWWLGSRAEAKHQLTVFGDEEAPEISDVTYVRSARASESVKISATLGDGRSAIYRAVLFYRVNGSAWQSVEMLPERRYVMEPIGGYGFEAEPFAASIPAQEAGSVVSYLVAAVDSVGNYAFSEVRRYEVKPAPAAETPAGKPAPSEKKGICGPTLVLLLALIPFLRRWWHEV